MSKSIIAVLALVMMLSACSLVEQTEFTSEVATLVPLETDPPQGTESTLPPSSLSPTVIIFSFR